MRPVTPGHWTALQTKYFGVLLWTGFFPCSITTHIYHLSQLIIFPPNVTFSLCGLEEETDVGAETYPQACERWGQAACMDFVCLFGSWMSWGLGLLWGNSRANSHFGEREARFRLSVSMMQFCWHSRCCLMFTPFLESKSMCASPCLLFSHVAKADSVKASFVSSLLVYLVVV